MSRPCIILPDSTDLKNTPLPPDEEVQPNAGGRTLVLDMRAVSTPEEDHERLVQERLRWYEANGYHPFDMPRQERPESPIGRLGRQAKAEIRKSFSRSRSRSGSRSLQESESEVAATSADKTADSLQVGAYDDDDSTSIYSHDGDSQAPEVESMSQRSSQGLLSPGYQPRPRSLSRGSLRTLLESGKAKAVRHARRLSQGSLSSYQSA